MIIEMDRGCAAPIACEGDCNSVGVVASCPSDTGQGPKQFLSPPPADSSPGSVIATTPSHITEPPPCEGIEPRAPDSVHTLESVAYGAAKTPTSGVAHQQHAAPQTQQYCGGSSSCSPATIGATILPPRKILARNSNNTLFPASLPSNLAELQLFRIMKNASLLYYYDTLLDMGGDDAQQLCDAGEEEFLEIMSLVGMASKPLHVRRLQKSLQEWVTNPMRFRTPLVAGEDFDVQQPANTVNMGPNVTGNNPPQVVYSPSSSHHSSQPDNLCKRSYSPLDTASCPPSSNSSPGSTSASTSASYHTTSILLDSQITKLAAAAERLSHLMPQIEPRPPNTKRKMTKELELVMSMADSDPRRMEEIRRYASIYGRFDCKRRPEKRLTLHEMCVNEAAAQICRFMPALLTRRDELFPLARQVVKDSGCHLAKTHHMCRQGSPDRSSLEGSSVISSTDAALRTSAKRERDDSDLDEPVSSPKRHEDMVQDEQKSRSVNEMRSLLQTKLRELERNVMIYTDDDDDDDDDDDVDDDSRYSYSNSNSPVQIRSACELEDRLQNKDQIKVIASSGNNIIAVANPALAMSSLITRNDENTKSDNVVLTIPLKMKKHDITKDCSVDAT